MRIVFSSRRLAGTLSHKETRCTCRPELNVGYIHYVIGMIHIMKFGFLFEKNINPIFVRSMKKRSDSSENG